MKRRNFLQSMVAGALIAVESAIMPAPRRAEAAKPPSWTEKVASVDCRLDFGLDGASVEPYRQVRTYLDKDGNILHIQETTIRGWQEPFHE